MAKNISLLKLILLLCLSTSTVKSTFAGCEIGPIPMVLETTASICATSNYQIQQLDTLPELPNNFEWMITDQQSIIHGFSYGLLINTSNLNSGQYCLSAIAYSGEENPLDKSEIIYGETGIEEISQQIEQGVCADFDPENCFPFQILPALEFTSASNQCIDTLGWFGNILINNGSGQYSSNLQAEHQFADSTLLFAEVEAEFLDFTVTDLQTGCNTNFTIDNPCICNLSLQAASILDYQLCADQPLIAEPLEYTIDSTEVFYYVLMKDSLYSPASVLTFNTTGTFDLSIFEENQFYLTSIVGSQSNTALPNPFDDCTIINTTASVSIYDPISVQYATECLEVEIGTECQILPRYDLTINVTSAYASATGTSIELTSTQGISESVASGQIIIISNLIYNAESPLFITDELGCQRQINISPPCDYSLIEGLSHAPDLPADTSFHCHNTDLQLSNMCFITNSSQTTSTYVLLTDASDYQTAFHYNSDGYFEAELLQPYTGQTLFAAAAVYPETSSAEPDINQTPLAIGSPMPIAIVEPLQLEFIAGECENQYADIQIIPSGGAPEISNNYIYTLNGDLQMGLQPDQQVSIELLQGQSIQLFLNDGTGCNIEFNFGPLDCPSNTMAYTIQQFNIYPIPASEQLYLQHAPHDLLSLQIYDTHGNLLLNLDSPNTLQGQGADISQLHPGIFFLLIQTKQQSQVLKFTKVN